MSATTTRETESNTKLRVNFSQNNCKEGGGSAVSQISENSDVCKEVCLIQHGRSTSLTSGNDGHLCRSNLRRKIFLSRTVRGGGFRSFPDQQPQDDVVQSLGAVDAVLRDPHRGLSAAVPSTGPQLCHHRLRH